MLEKEFIPYEQALALKELGFDEPCFGLFNNIKPNEFYQVHSHASTGTGTFIKAPLYQQAFRWLYQKLDIEKSVMPLDSESQQLLLKELIDKVSSKHLLL